MSRIGSLDNPDWMLLDLDPVDTSFDRIVEAALLVKELLDQLGLRGYPKTTGGDGMHVYVPLDPIYSYEQVRSFAELVTHLAVDASLTCSPPQGASRSGRKIASILITCRLEQAKRSQLPTFSGRMTAHRLLRRSIGKKSNRESSPPTSASTTRSNASRALAISLLLCSKAVNESKMRSPDCKVRSRKTRRQKSPPRNAPLNQRSRSGRRKLEGQAGPVFQVGQLSIGPELGEGSRLCAGKAGQDQAAVRRGDS